MIDLVVISSGDFQRLKACLSSLGACMKRTAGARLIVVIDTVDDTCFELARSLTDAARTVIAQGPLKGRAAARNFGAALGTGSRLAFLDGDMLVPADWLANHACGHGDRPAIRRGMIRELVAAAIAKCFCDGARGFPPLDGARLARSGFHPSGYRLARSLLEAAVEERFEMDDPALPCWLAGAGANYSITREDWKRLGGQAEAFGRRWGCEDLEFSYRATLHGLEIEFLPQACAFHLSHRQPDRWRNHEQSLALFAELAGDPSILELGRLLGPAGSLQAYLDLVRGATG
jgi:hypothetical protein